MFYYVIVFEEIKKSVLSVQSAKSVFCYANLEHYRIKNIHSLKIHSL